MNQPGPGLDQSSEEHNLESDLEDTRAERFQQDGRWDFCIHDPRVHADHGEKEEEAGNHCDGPGQSAGDERLTSGLVESQRGENRWDHGEVVTSIGQPGPRPSATDWLRAQVRHDIPTEHAEAPNKENGVQAVENERPC